MDVLGMSYVNVEKVVIVIGCGIEKFFMGKVIGFIFLSNFVIF